MNTFDFGRHVQLLLHVIGGSRIEPRLHWPELVRERTLQLQHELLVWTDCQSLLEYLVSLRGTPTEKTLIGYLSVLSEALNLGEVSSLLHVATHLNMSDFLTKTRDSLVWRKWISTGRIFVEPGRYNRAEARKQLKEAASKENERRSGATAERINVLCARVESVLAAGQW